MRTSSLCSVVKAMRVHSYAPYFFDAYHSKIPVKISERTKYKLVCSTYQKPHPDSKQPTLQAGLHPYCKSYTWKGSQSLSSALGFRRCVSTNADSANIDRPRFVGAVHHTGSAPVAELRRTKKRTIDQSPCCREKGLQQGGSRYSKQVSAYAAIIRRNQGDSPWFFRA